MTELATAIVICTKLQELNRKLKIQLSQCIRFIGIKHKDERKK